MFWGRWPDPLDVGYMVVAAGVALVIGMKVFNHLEDEMANEL